MVVDVAAWQSVATPGARQARGSLLLLEPFSLLRQTVVAVAAELDIAEVHQASTFESAWRLLQFRRFDGCVLAIGDDRREMELIDRLRAGHGESLATTPIAVMTTECDAGLVLALRDLHVTRILLKPFKVKSILNTVSLLLHRPVSS
jgi:DNA-binding NarL/FixJ family response regulator